MSIRLVRLLSIKYEKERMEIFQAYNPDIAYLIHPHLPLDTEDEKTIAAMELRDFMIARPEDHCVIVGFDSDNNLQGYLYGWLINNQQYTWIESAWASKSFSQENVDTVFDLFQQWTIFKGFKRIRMQTKRDKAFARKYKFNPYAVVMERIL